MDWIHCNRCTATGARGFTFWFTSCGHIICGNCMKEGVPSPGRKGPCIVCHKNASIVELNRSMKPEILDLFKSPAMLLAESTQRLKTTLNFQSGHRQALAKKMGEKYEKSIKYCKAAQAEIATRNEREKALIAEREQLRAELDKAKECVHRLEKKVKERDHEIHRLRRKSPTKRHSPRKFGFPSLNGNTPITSLSFLDCAMSTPNNVDGMDFMVDNDNGGDIVAQSSFRLQNAQDDTPIAGPAFFPTTPYLLGLERDITARTQAKYF